MKNCGRSHNRHSAILLYLSSDFGDSTIPFLFAAAISSLEAKAFLAASVGKYLSTNLWITPRCFTRLKKFKTTIDLKLFSGTYLHTQTQMHGNQKLWLFYNTSIKKINLKKNYIR